MSMSMSGLKKDFWYNSEIPPVKFKDLLTHSHIKGLQGMLLGNFNPYTENLDPKYRSLAFKNG